MLESRAIVVEWNEEEGQAIVEPVQGGSCGFCNGGSGCGSSKLSQLFCIRPRRFRVRNTIKAHIGEEVQVSVADGILLRSAAILYGLPMLFLFGGALMGSSWMGSTANQDAGAAVGAVIGLVAGFLVAKYFASVALVDEPAIARLKE
jgi:sigma-E factor negative regulatory protein RseC